MISHVERTSGEPFGQSPAPCGDGSGSEPVIFRWAGYTKIAE